MYAARCPGCGAPAPLTLAEPNRLRCPSCGYDGASPPGVAAHLGAAAEQLFRDRERARQLGNAQRRLIASGFWSSVVYVALGLAVLIPCPCCLWLAFRPDEAFDAADFSCIAVPVLVSLLGLAGGLVVIARARRRLAEACAAVPPAGPGEPAGCHVCGGPVAPDPGSPFARCPYCKADNLVDPSLLARWRVRRERAHDHYEEVARRESGGVGRAFTWSMVALVGLTGAGPVLGALIGIVIAVSVDYVEDEPVDAARYTVVDTPVGRCIASVTNDDGPLTYMAFAPTVTDDVGSYPDARPAAEIPTFGWRELEGLRVRLPNQSWLAAEDVDLTVARVHGVYLRPENRARLTGPGIEGESETVSPEALCLAPGAASPVPPIPLSAGL